jgi:hypothetical protein
VLPAWIATAVILGVWVLLMALTNAVDSNDRMRLRALFL